MTRRAAKKTAKPAARSLAALVVEFGITLESLATRPRSHATREMSDVEYAFTNYQCAIEDAETIGVEAAMIRYYLNMEDETSDCRDIFRYLAREWSGIEV